MTDSIVMALLGLMLLVGLLVGILIGAAIVAHWPDDKS